MSINKHLYIYKPGYPNVRVQQNPLRANILQKQETTTDNASPEFNFCQQETRKLKNKIRPKGSLTELVEKQRQTNAEQPHENISLIEQIQSSAMEIVEAHDFQKSLDGMQSLPVKKMSHKVMDDMDSQQLVDNILQRQTQPKFSSAKIHRTHQLREEIDYDSLRQQNLQGRRSTRQQREPAPNVLDDDDFNIAGESIYIFRGQ
ncbi:Conserved_hypothetical protein [Hexamita inflata]|uniref:Uncharacterized protein n=1 Tax=Hexamita inflata TaxID=28002 RepID=A0AA86NSL0_9EUKA|nr:Conserved hypothetical protein [Hexamita inflata]CAI9934437.1 Conserved hypothetical protein [Hexamita inflata]